MDDDDVLEDHPELWGHSETVKSNSISNKTSERLSKKGRTRKRDKAVHGTITDLFPVTKIKAEETVSIDEAVSYGFEMFKGILKYVIVLIILGVITFLIMLVSIEEREPAIGLLAIPVYVILLILNFSLMIGVFYKLWVDILARSRK